MNTYEITGLLAFCNFWDCRRFFGMKSCFMYKISSKFNGVSISIANAISSSNTGKPQKGECRYDHKNAVVVTIKTEDIIQFIKALPEVARNKYVNDTVDDPRFKNTFVYDVYKTKIYISFAKIKDQIGNVNFSIVKYTDDGEKQSGSFILRSNQIKQLLVFLQASYSNMDFASSIFEACVNKLKFTLYTYSQYKKSKDADKNNNYKDYSNNNYTENIDNSFVPDERTNSEDIDLPFDDNSSNNNNNTENNDNSFVPDADGIDNLNELSDYF